MKIRLIIPECTKWNDWLCLDAIQQDAVDTRTQILHRSMQEETVDLIVTSHNYFVFSPTVLQNQKDFIKKRVIDDVLSNIPIKVRKSLILGYDLMTDDILFNPFGAENNAVVAYIPIAPDGNYYYGTHIWECWQGKGDCICKCFIEQNHYRQFEINSIRFGILSCGDIARYCHDDGKLLPSVDIYIDLSHKSLRGWTSQNKIPHKIINDWEKSHVVIITQQVNNTERYKRQQGYPYIFYDNQFNVSNTVITYKINSSRGVYVDVVIQ